MNSHSMTKACRLLFVHVAVINVLTPHCDQHLYLKVSSGEGGDFAGVFALICRTCAHENQSRVCYWVAGCESNTPCVCSAFCERETECNVTVRFGFWPFLWSIQKRMMQTTKLLISKEIKMKKFCTNGSCMKSYFSVNCETVQWKWTEKNKTSA